MSVLTWLVLKFLDEPYVLHDKRTSAKETAIVVIGIDQTVLNCS